MVHDFKLVLMYIDPGIGFFILQMVVGSILGAMFYFRRAVSLVLTKVGIRVRRKHSEADDGQTDRRS